MDLVEGISIGQIEDQDDSISVLIKLFGNRHVFFLSGSICELDFDIIAIYFFKLIKKLNTYGGSFIEIEFISGIPFQEVGFSHRRVSDDGDFQVEFIVGKVLHSN